MKAGYVPGSMYKRFYGSNMSRMNRHVVSNADSSVTTYGPKIFEAKQTQVAGQNELIVQQILKKIQAEGQAKINAAKASFGSLSGTDNSKLGAFTDTSA